MEQVINFFKNLGKNNDIENGCVSGMLTIRIGLNANSCVHVCGKHYSFMDKPEFYACYAFYANCSFASCCNKTMIEAYNKKNSEKIERFNSIEQLINFLNH